SRTSATEDAGVIRSIRPPEPAARRARTGLAPARPSGARALRRSAAARRRRGRCPAGGAAARRRAPRRAPAPSPPPRPARLRPGEQCAGRDLTALDREQALLERARRFEDRRAVAEPPGGTGDESKQVVGVLRAELAGELEVGRLVARERDEGAEVAPLEQA